MKTLLIGQAPARRGDGEPLSGRAGRRLAACCGITLPRFLDTFDRVNLVDFWPGEAPNGGDVFPLKQARAAAQEMTEKVAARDRVVLLGNGVARAFRVQRVPILTWKRFFRDGTEYAVCPHPSGRSRWWNDPVNVACAAAFWADITPDAAPSSSRTR